MGEVALGDVIFHAAHGFGDTVPVTTESTLTKLFVKNRSNQATPIVNRFGQPVNEFVRERREGKTTLSDGTKAWHYNGRLVDAGSYRAVDNGYVNFSKTTPSGKQLDSTVRVYSEEGKAPTLEHEKYIVDPVTGKKSFKSSRLLTTPRQQNAAKRVIASKFGLEYTPRVEISEVGKVCYTRTPEVEDASKKVVEEEMKRLANSGMTDPKDIRRSLARTFHPDSVDPKIVPAGVNARELFDVVTALDHSSKRDVIGVKPGGQIKGPGPVVIEKTDKEGPRLL